jgi:hypothetical protein
VITATDARTVLDALRNGHPPVLITSHSAKDSAADALQARITNQMQLPLARVKSSHVFDGIVRSVATSTVTA